MAGAETELAIDHDGAILRGMPSFARYSELIQEPVAPVVLDLICDWLQWISGSTPAAR